MLCPGAKVVSGKYVTKAESLAVATLSVREGSLPLIALPYECAPELYSVGIAIPPSVVENAKSDTPVALLLMVITLSSSTVLLLASFPSIMVSDARKNLKSETGAELVLVTLYVNITACPSTTKDGVHVICTDDCAS